MAPTGALLAAASIALSQTLLNPAYKIRQINPLAALADIAGGATALAICAIIGLAMAALLRNPVATLLLGAALADRIYADGRATTPLVHTSGAWLLSAAWLAAAAAASVVPFDRRGV
jgi:hypothetical protein